MKKLFIILILISGESWAWSSDGANFCLVNDAYKKKCLVSKDEAPWVGSMSIYYDCCYSKPTYELYKEAN